MKKVILLALMVLTIFSCTQDENLVNNGDAKVVKLSIKAGSLTRAAGQPLANGSVTSINSLFVYFLDAAAGNIVAGSRVITSSELTEIKSAGGLEITGVSASAKYVYVVANFTENSVDLSGVTTLAGIKAKTALMTTPNTADWNKALLSNSDKLNNGLIGAVVNNAASATVEIMPDLTRLEISTLAAKAQGDVTAPDVAVTAYDLKGVYLNAYFSEFHVGGAAQGNAAALNTSGAQLAGVPTWAKDVYSPELTGSTSYTAASGPSTNPGDIWHYMLPAGTAPRIIFDIDNVEYSSGSPATQDKFITVKGFTDTGTGNPITSFERGKIYRIAAVNFSAKDAHDNPNAEDINVTVTVEILGWEGIDVNPEL